jgi:ABC-2 type transport system permease protein
MPIFDQGYQHWEGHLSGHAWRWLTITRQGIRVQMKNRWVRLVTLSALIPALVLAGFLICWGLIEQKSSMVSLFLPLFQGLLPPGAMEGPKAYRVAIWTISYQYFFRAQMYSALLLVLLVGPGLISQDLRFNAIPLYFSRPLRRFDYFLGKLGVIGVFLGGVVILPTLIAYVLGVGFSMDASVAWDTARVAGAAVAYGLVIVVSAGTLMLAISSLSRNSRYVAVVWFGFWFLTGNISVFLMESLRDESYHLVSFVSNLNRVGNALLDTKSAWDKLTDLGEERRTLVTGVPPPSRRDPRMQGGMGEPPLGPGGAGSPRPGPRQQRPPQYQPEGRPTVSLWDPSYPWYWSAGVLAGLFGLSLWILSSRVKSLDRLR